MSVFVSESLSNAAHKCKLFLMGKVEVDTEFQGCPDTPQELEQSITSQLTLPWL